MLPAQVAYHRPATLAEATGLLAEHHDAGARVLAGGTELLLALHSGRVPVSVRHLISLRDVPGLDGVHNNTDDRGLHVGAMTRLNDVARSSLVADHCPALATAARAMAGEQVRNHATIGGNFCGAVPCADTPPVALVADATLEIAVPGQSHTRHVPARRFFLGPRITALQPGEILVAIYIPAARPGSAIAVQRFARRGANSLAVASVAARVTMDGERVESVRLAMGAVAPIPLLLDDCAGEPMLGNTPDDARIDAVARRAADAAQPITDVRGTISFRRHLVHVLTRRALQLAIATAGADVAAPTRGATA
ncbi:MAG: xanthine dehydrogenase family protein subunit M [Planctomycetota bacterium]